HLAPGEPTAYVLGPGVRPLDFGQASRLPDSAADCQSDQPGAPPSGAQGGTPFDASSASSSQHRSQSAGDPRPLATVVASPPPRRPPRVLRCEADCGQGVRRTMLHQTPAPGPATES